MSRHNRQLRYANRLVDLLGPVAPLFVADLIAAHHLRGDHRGARQWEGVQSCFGRLAS